MSALVAPFSVLFRGRLTAKPKPKVINLPTPPLDRPILVRMPDGTLWQRTYHAPSDWTLTE